ncbi:MAG: hypothetical protein Q9160_002260 [Pyrenula sp. 1 TL-2023]
MFNLPSKPIGLRWRSSTLFIVATVAIGLFTDLFLYGLIVPVLPFLLRDRIDLPQDQVQSYVSGLLAAYAGASVLFSLPAGILADKVKTRQAPFLSGLAALLAATVLLAFGQSIPVLIIARILQGTSAAFVWTVGLAMVLDTVGPDKLGTTIGSIFSFISVGELAAPVVGGVVYAKAGYGGIFGIGAAILAIDFIMRVLVVEKKTAARYEGTKPTDANSQAQITENGTPRDPLHQDHHDHAPGADEEAQSQNGHTEESPLLPKPDNKRSSPSSAESFKIPPNQPRSVRAFPILYPLTSPRLLTALLVAFVQASLISTFDATLPTEAESLFNFSSLRAGLLFIALDITYLVLGPLAGRAVDKYGPKPAAVLGFGYLVPMLILLRLPHSGGKSQLILYCALLALNGVGLAIIGSPSIVEASSVVKSYDEANPGFFGENGPYAQLYGLNSLVFSAGLTVGPVVSGVLRDSIGYGNMNLVVAIVCAVTATLSFIFIGGTPKMLSRKER